MFLLNTDIFIVKSLSNAFIFETLSFPHPLPPPDLRAFRADLECKWNKLGKDCEERRRRLESASHHLRHFDAKMEEMRKWTEKMKKKVDDGGEIFEDEADEALKR